MLSVSSFNQSISPAWSHPHMTMMKNVGPLWQRTCQSAPESSSWRSFLLWQVVRIVQRIFQCSLDWKTFQVMLSTPQATSQARATLARMYWSLDLATPGWKLLMTLRPMVPTHRLLYEARYVHALYIFIGCMNTNS